MCLAVNSAVCAFDGAAMWPLIERLFSLCDWSYGYGLEDLVERRPDFHVMEGDSGELSAVESAGADAWYRVPEDVRASTLRSWYRLMFLRDSRFSVRLANGQSLDQCLDTFPSELDRMVGRVRVFLGSNGTTSRILSLLVASGAVRSP